MEPITRATFMKWAQEQKWIQISDVPTANGRQCTYITPAGATPVVMFDLKGNLTAVGYPMPTQQPTPNIAPPKQPWR